MQLIFDPYAGNVAIPYSNAQHELRKMEQWEKGKHIVRPSIELRIMAFEDKSTHCDAASENH